MSHHVFGFIGVVLGMVGFNTYLLTGGTAFGVLGIAGLFLLLSEIYWAVERI